MNWFLIVRYPQDVRYVGPFPSREVATAWVAVNRSELWLSWEAKPLEAPDYSPREDWSASWR